MCLSYLQKFLLHTRLMLCKWGNIPNRTEAEASFLMNAIVDSLQFNLAFRLLVMLPTDSIAIMLYAFPKDVK